MTNYRALEGAANQATRQDGAENKVTL